MTVALRALAITIGAALWAVTRGMLRLFAMAGGLSVRALMLHDGRWPSIISAAGLGLLAVGLMSCAGPKFDTAGLYQRCGPTESILTGWLTEAQFLKVAADQRARGCYPVAIKGEMVPAANMRLYRATFKPHPDNIVQWRASVGHPSAEDTKFALSLTEQGYVRIWRDDVMDDAGLRYVQSVWTKSH